MSYSVYYNELEVTTQGILDQLYGKEWLELMLDAKDIGPMFPEEEDVRKQGLFFTCSYDHSPGFSDLAVMIMPRYMGDVDNTRRYKLAVGGILFDRVHKKLNMLYVRRFVEGQVNYETLVYHEWSDRLEHTLIYGIEKMTRKMIKF